MHFFQLGTSSKNSAVAEILASAFALFQYCEISNHQVPHQWPKVHSDFFTTTPPPLFLFFLSPFLPPLLISFFSSLFFLFSSSLQKYG
jgi:hypothetical protein